MTLKFHQFYSPKNTRRDTHKTQQPISPTGNSKKLSFSTENLSKNRKAEEKIFEFF